MEGVSAGMAAATAALAQAEAVAAVGSAEAQAAYALMYQILKNKEAPLIFPSLLLTASGIGEGLSAYEATLVEKRLQYAETKIAWEEAQRRAGGDS